MFGQGKIDRQTRGCDGAMETFCRSGVVREGHRRRFFNLSDFALRCRRPSGSVPLGYDAEIESSEARPFEKVTIPRGVRLLWRPLVGQVGFIKHAIDVNFFEFWEHLRYPTAILACYDPSNATASPTLSRMFVTLGLLQSTTIGRRYGVPCSELKAGVLRVVALPRLSFVVVTLDI